MGDWDKRPYHQLVAWQRADEFVKAVYHVSALFPPDERFGMTSQLRRAALSVPLNIIEGNARGSSKDNVKFLFIARGSLAESRYLLELAKDFGYIDQQRYDAIDETGRKLSFLLQRLLESRIEHP